VFPYLKHNMAATESNDDTWSAAAYNKTASFVYSSAYTSKVLTMLNAKAGEHVMDFGCGTGEVTAAIAKQVGSEGRVVGFDASESMVGISNLVRC